MAEPLQPEGVEQQFTGFLDLMNDDTGKADAMLKKLADSGLTTTDHDIRDIVAEALAPVLETLEEVRRVQSAVVDGLTLFREEMLSRLPGLDAATSQPIDQPQGGALPTPKD